MSNITYPRMYGMGYQQFGNKSYYKEFIEEGKAICYPNAEKFEKCYKAIMRSIKTGDLIYLKTTAPPSGNIAARI